MSSVPTTLEMVTSQSSLELAHCGLRLGGHHPTRPRSHISIPQVCEPLPSLLEVRNHAQMSLNLLSPAHRRLHKPQPYPVCPPRARHHWLTSRNTAQPWWPGQSHRDSTMELLTVPSCSHARWPSQSSCTVSSLSCSRTDGERGSRSPQPCTSSTSTLI